MAQQKLLYIINHMDWFWSHRLPLARAAKEAGWDVHVAATNAAGDEKLEENGFHGLELPPADRGFAPFAVLNIIFAIHKMISTEKPDLIHAITLKYAFMAGLAARVHKNVKIVHTIAGLGYLFSGEGFKPKLLRIMIGPFLKLALKSPNMQIIFQNPDDQDMLIARGFVRAEQCHLIRGSGVDTEEFSPKENAEEDPPVIVMPTRLVHDKGVAVFVETARILKNKGVEARFQIAGGVTAHNPLAISQEEMEAMTADGAAEWLGKVSDMPGLLARSALVVYPSYYREGIPKVLLEAASMGKPIITTDHPGCREAVAHNDNGLLVPVKDAEATAAAVEMLLSNVEKRKNMGVKSREKAQKEFDVNLINEKTLTVYRA